MGERLEALLRIVVAIITGIILYIFAIVVNLIMLVHWIYVIISGRRSRPLAEFCNAYCSIQYKYLRYLTFTTNDRPIPFGSGEEIRPVEMSTRKRR